MHILRCVCSLLLLALALLACAPATPDPGMVQTAIAETLAASPTSTPLPTPTRLPLAAIDVEALIYQPGDLPPNFTPGQYRAELNGEVPAPQGFAALGFLDNKNLASDGATIALYENPEDASEFISYHRKRMERGGEVEPIDVGEEGYYLRKEAKIGADTFSVLFQRCSAAVYVELFSNAANQDTITTYAKRIDGRLQDSICTSAP